MRPTLEKFSTVLLSGGVDSAACTHLLLSQGLTVSGLFIDYGQSAKQYEEESARKIADHYKIDLNICRISTCKTFSSGEIIGRNAFLIFSALMFSKQTRGIIALGIHAGTGYYDCSPDFFTDINSIVENYSFNEVKLLAPFLHWEKGDIFSYCKKNEIPLNLTYSCESGTNPACGRCNSCRDRELHHVK